MVVLCATGHIYAQTAPVRVDPYEIRRCIAGNPDFDVAGLWQTLGISAKLDTVYSRVGMEPVAPATFDECKECEAEICPLAVEGDPDGEVVLTIRQRWGLCRFLLFRPIRSAAMGRSEWRFIGHADHDFAPYDMPACRGETIGETRYLVMTAQAVSGTGVSLFYERWYEIAPSGMREVLTLPARGHECGDALSLCRTFQSHVMKEDSDDNRIRVDFRFAYSGDEFLIDGKAFAELELFVRQQRATYVRGGRSRDFSLSALESGISKDEIRTVCTIGGLTCGDFLRFNISEISLLASGDNSRIRAWLTKYLSNCEQTPERADLLKSLLLPAPRLSAGYRDRQLIEAAKQGDVAKVLSLLKKGANANVRETNGQLTRMGYSPLMWAASKGHKAVVEALLAGGADVHAGDSENRTALMMAAANGHPDIAALLIAGGADIHAKSLRNDTALMAAAAGGRPEIVQRLLDMGAAADWANDIGETALMAAALRGHAGTVEVLLTGGARVDAIDEMGNTALILASTGVLYEGGGSAETVKLLLADGAEVNGANDSGITALMGAATRGNSEVVRVLLAAGADRKARVFSGHDRGETALSLALRNNHGETARLLQEGE